MNDVNLADISEGYYAGEYSVGVVEVRVSVEVIDNKIQDIIIEHHQNGLGKKAEGITDKIIAAGSLDVDVVSGATLSSNVIRKAVEIALTK